MATTRNELLSAKESLRVAILASEEWQESYKSSPTTFQRLIELEASLETAVAEYLLELSARAPSFVDWSRLPEPIKADAGPVANNDDPAWEAEEILLTIAIADIITELVATGAIAGETLYGIPMGYTSFEFATLDEAILKAARLHTAQLVKRVTETTRNQIRESIAKSITLGEDAAASTERLKQIINNPVRACRRKLKTGHKRNSKSEHSQNKECDHFGRLGFDQKARKRRSFQVADRP